MGVRVQDSGWARLHHLGCSLFLLVLKAHRGAEPPCASAARPLLPRALGEAASLFLRGNQASFSRGTAFVFLCYGPAIILNHDFSPASPGTFGFANLTLPSCHPPPHTTPCSLLSAPLRFCPLMHHLQPFPSLPAASPFV